MITYFQAIVIGLGSHRPRLVPDALGAGSGAARGATPVIFAAGAYKVADLLGPFGDGVRGQALAGSVLSLVHLARSP